MIVVPCNGCQDREVGCAGKCERWAKYKAMKRIQYENRLKERQLHTIGLDNYVKRVQREKIVDRQRKGRNSG